MKDRASTNDDGLGETASGGPAKVGADLRAARQRLGWALPDIAASLRVQLAYLEALEQGRVADLPAPAYAIGYLRAYAAALGLDADEQAKRFKAAGAGAGRDTKLDFPVPVPDRDVPAGAMVLLAVVLAVGSYVAWYRLSGEGRLPAEVVQPVPERLAPLAEQAIPLPPAQRTVTPPPAPSQLALKAPELALPPMPSVPPSSAAAAIAYPTPSAAAVTPLASSPLNPDESRIVLRARSDAWVQVRDKAGPVLLNRILRAGETWPVPAKPNLVLTTGNAGGTDLLVDGVQAPGFGGAGAVRRDLPLDPDLIREGRLPAQTQVTTSQPSTPVAPSASPRGSSSQ